MHRLSVPVMGRKDTGFLGNSRPRIWTGPSIVNVRRPTHTGLWIVVKVSTLDILGHADLLAVPISTPLRFYRLLNEPPQRRGS